MKLHDNSFQTPYSFSAGNFFEVRFQLIMLCLVNNQSHEARQFFCIDQQTRPNQIKLIITILVKTLEPKSNSDFECFIHTGCPRKIDTIMMLGTYNLRENGATFFLINAHLEQKKGVKEFTSIIFKRNLKEVRFTIYCKNLVLGFLDYQTYVVIF